MYNLKKELFFYNQISVRRYWMTLLKCLNKGTYLKHIIKDQISRIN
jgi:hypothetical protein